jgi:hypothetical protein
MVETKEPEIILTENNTNTCDKGETRCVYCIVVFFIVWIGAVIYVSQLHPSEF